LAPVAAAPQGFRPVRSGPRQRLVAQPRARHGATTVQGTAAREASPQTMGKPWENHGKTIRKPWKTMENHRNTIGKW